MSPIRPEWNFKNETTTTEHIFKSVNEKVDCGKDSDAEYVGSRVIVLILCVFGLVGNILCFIVMTRKEMKSSYIYILIGLSCSDAMLLLFTGILALENLQILTLPGDFYSSWYFHFSDWISTGGIKFYTVGISVERCFAVHFPVCMRVWFTDAKAKLCAILVFGFDFAIAVFSFWYQQYDNWAYELFYTIVVHILPILLVVGINILIFIQLRKAEQIRKELTRLEADETTSITRMLLTVVFIFGFSYSFITWKRISMLIGTYDYCRNTTRVVVLFHRIFSVFNSSVNFIIYCLLGKRFRTEFLKVVRACYSGSITTPPPVILTPNTSLTSSTTV